MTQCPICACESVTWDGVQGYAINDCTSCLHRFVSDSVTPNHVQEVYSDEYFHGGGAGYSDYLGQSQLLQARGRYFANIAQKHSLQRGKVLDVGAAAGFLLRGWLDSQWEGIGVEPNRSMCNYAQKLGLDIRCSTFEQLDGVEHESIDCVSMVQVLSHFVNPGQALQLAYTWLRPGGTLLIETWNRSSWSAKLAGKGWHEYSPPSVLHWFTPESLRRSAKHFGFELIASKRSVRYINLGHANSLLSHAAKESKIYWLANQVTKHLPSRWNVPYPGDDLFWSLFRKPQTIPAT